MPDTTGDGFEVEPTQLTRAGDNAIEIGQHLRGHHDDIATADAAVSAGLPGFSVATSLHSCTTEWQDELDECGSAVVDKGRALVESAEEYVRADDVASRWLGSVGATLEEATGW